MLKVPSLEDDGAGPWIFFPFAAFCSKVFIQSDVLDVALEMRNQFDSLPHVLKHIDEIESSMLCDSEGWLLNNPMGKRTEREIHAEFEGAKIYRRVYQKQAQKALG
ncbi:hypothetical protein RchiOBHm_Chr1g0340401 [Rosa chinensis]|uniref:tRNA (guanine(46)-N(7))-methyltransferase n=1 Tax=Rosa chinensis TaxID=74649 RepID=A0A2P6SDF6_ROSCH|nr:hypothetical protein RchiOBHm_Chr1g0340401 [Rosa chinensis]